MRVPDYAIPQDVEILSATRNRIAEVNSVYRCTARCRNSTLGLYLKVCKSTTATMDNERDALVVLGQQSFPVPRVLWHGVGRRSFMALEERPGTILRDVLNPLSDNHLPHMTNRVLHQLGELVGWLHTIKLDWQPQKRTSLYGLLGEQELDDPRFQELVHWLRQNAPHNRDQVFVHGDLNDANVLVNRGEVSAILDWESAGIGWREYELAWILRERRNYMNSVQAREFFLDGYGARSTYDRHALRWCEVMNCMHVAFWCKDRYRNFMDFNLQKAREAMQRRYD
ncbi:MAG: hypothetical protein EA384_08690 [Spirochaetaceae bacterium]|nr:MAG: hypothetical protein EA384_08690 [Spirochaetaceae bacterium]